MKKTMTREEATQKIMIASSIGSSIGLFAGLVFAFRKKKKFWGYVGFGLLGSIVFGIPARLITYATISGKINKDPMVDKTTQVIAKNSAGVMGR